MTYTLDVFKSLSGTWTFRRTISCHGSVTGKAAFTQLSDNRLKYREDGQFTDTSGKVFTCYQEYTYCYENGQIVVYFVDERKFHTLEFSSDLKIAHANHLCKCDYYNAIYTFADDFFNIHYVIKGPNKDYTTTTNFTRII